MDRNKERMTHILVECPELIASVKVGVLIPLEPQAGITYDIKFRCTRDIRWKDICWADVFICVRGCEEATKYLVSQAKKEHRFIVYYLDDDLLHLPKESGSYAYYADITQAEALRTILQYSDVLWGVNPRIKDKYLSLCGGHRWIWNRVPMKIKETPQKNTGSVRILYAGSKDHEHMIRQILVPAVRKVCEDEGDRVHFTFLGVDSGIRDLPQVSNHNYFENYDDYRRFVENGNFAVGLAAIRTEEFYQCKYYNKFVEYSSIGAAGVFTDCELYRQVVVDGENGLLCSNDPGAWVVAIEQMVENAELRNACINNAQRFLRTEFACEDVCRCIMRQLPELIEYRAPKVTRVNLLCDMPKVMFYWSRMKFLFRQHGLLAIPVICQKAIKKAVRKLRGN